VVAVDLPGFGESPSAGRGAGLMDQRRIVSQLIASLGGDPVVLVGNSMGGMLSLIQCAHLPHTVSSMILTCAAFPRPRALVGQPSPRVAALFALYSNRRLGEWFVQNRARRLGPERLVSETLRVCTVDPGRLDPALVAAHVELARQRFGFDYATKAFMDAARSIFLAQAAPGRYRALVAKARRPALVIHGARDQLVPVGAARSAAASHPDWKLVVLGDAGHIPQMELPDLWLAAVEDWLEEQGLPDLAASG
jgi:pimeloyl-ACP methyl ester carboxylesterase